jgi:hypothetical protein
LAKKSPQTIDRVRGLTQTVECLPSKHKVLCSNFRPTRRRRRRWGRTGRGEKKKIKKA